MRGKIILVAVAMAGCGPSKEDVAALEARLAEQEASAERARWAAGPDDRGRATDEILANEFVNEVEFRVGERVTMKAKSGSTAFIGRGAEIEEIELDWADLAKFGCETLRKHHAVSAKQLDVVVMHGDVEKDRLACPHHTLDWKD